MTYTVVIIPAALSNRSKARDHGSQGTDADKRIVRIAVMIGSATVAVVTAGVAGCVVAIRLRTVKLSDVKKRHTGIAKSATVLRRSLTVNVDRRERCTTSLVCGTGSTCQTVSHPVSVAWADCTLSPVEVEASNNQRQQMTTSVEQHQFRMRIFPAACIAYD